MTQFLLQTVSSMVVLILTIALMPGIALVIRGWREKAQDMPDTLSLPPAETQVANA